MAAVELYTNAGSPDWLVPGDWSRSSGWLICRSPFCNSGSPSSGSAVGTQALREVTLLVTCMTATALAPWLPARSLTRARSCTVPTGKAGTVKVAIPLLSVLLA